MKTLIFSVALVVAGFAAHAQDFAGNADGRIIQNNGNFLTRFDSRYEGMKGTPYFIPQWIKGNMEFVDGKKFSNVPLKYNSLTKELMMIRPGGDSLIIYPYQVKHFALIDPTAIFQFKRYPEVKTNEKGVSRDAYFLVLYEGKSSLLKMVSKKIRKADFKDPYSTGVRYDNFEDDSQYFVLKEDGTLVKVKMGRKSLLNALEDKKGVEDYVKAQGLEVKSEKEMVQVVQQYDAI